MTKTRAFYSGDLNIEHGGYFYSLADWKWGYVSAVRLTPCTDAGGADNCYWVEWLTVNIESDVERLRPLLACSGLTIGSLPNGAARRHCLVDAHISYGCYDLEHSRVVQLGAEPPTYGEPIEPDVILRANRSLSKYVRQQLVEGW